MSLSNAVTYELLTGRSHVDSEGEPEAAANLASLRNRNIHCGWSRLSESDRTESRSWNRQGQVGWCVDSWLYSGGEGS